MKKALFTFITAGVRYEKGEVYADETVADLDLTNFEDITETVTEVETVEVLDSNEVKADLDTEIVDDNKGGDADDNKGADVEVTE
jgi:hypothetical protein